MVAGPQVRAVYSGFNKDEEGISGINGFFFGAFALQKHPKSQGHPDATLLLRDCVCMPQVCLMFGPGSGSVTEDE